MTPDKPIKEALFGIRDPKFATLIEAEFLGLERGVWLSIGGVTHALSLPEFLALVQTLIGMVDMIDVAQQKQKGEEITP